MSLQLAAQHLASRGRGPDTTLVHMAPREVAGLQALAKAHGGSLTVNPDTGLAEAGFLSSILPMVAGAALAATGVGAPLAAGIVGGGMTLATGSLQKGLMAGLGAYGGAGIAGGLMGAGAAGAAEAGAGAMGAMGPQTAAQLGSGFEASMAAQGITPTIGATGASMGAQTAGQLGAGFQADMAAQGIQSSPIQADLAVKNAVPTLTKAPTPGFTDNISQMFQGAKNLGEESGRTAFMDKIGGTKGLMQYGLAGLAPVGMEMMKPKPMAERSKDKPYMYAYEPGRVADPQAGYTGAYTGERTYFNPVYTRTAAGGGLMDIGPIESMSRNNEAEVMMSNGGTRFAEGGETKAVRPVEQDPYYTMSGQSGDAFKYLMGQMPAPSRAPAPAPVAAAPTQSAQPASTLSPTQQIVDRNFQNPFIKGGANAIVTAMDPAAQQSGALGAVRSMLGGSQSGATMRPYTFDPVTGTFTAMPIADPNAADIGGTPAPFSRQEDSYGMATGGIASLAQGGESHLGDYSDGGRLLRGPGDGVSDDIPATIGDKRPARLADGEFVVPARIVSELGNGSTEAGARKLYAMMDRVQKARSKTVGKDRVATDTKAARLLPV